MIPYHKALSTVLACANPLGFKTIKLEQAGGSVLTKDIFTTHNIPFFDNSAVDGFGVRTSDVKNASNESPIKLQLTGTIKAGDGLRAAVTPGTAVKILTGAPIPAGVEAVIMKEFCFEEKKYIYVKKSASRWENIRREGEEFHLNDCVIEKGTYISPPVIGLLATLGYKKCCVYLKPRVSIIVTGSELIKVGKKLTFGKIYESNSYALVAALNEIGIKKYSVVCVKDDKKIIKKQIKKALKNSDVIISVGGISTGDYDFVKEIFNSLGVKTLFTKVAMKPAKPNYFGSFKRKLVFGLPGNPVSALVSFHQFIKPALLKIMGAKSITPFQAKAILSENLTKKPGRLEFVRGILEQKNGDLLVRPTQGQGSHMLGGIANANCLIYFPEEQKLILKGEKVDIDLLSWN
ncbi:MAG: molybdopterin molybdotransferase MoeA [Candidatus Melainabacteria bacterium]|nr:molybdopterin molybdotransferase MoeA [Candidatus Melainabacteria bacterium]